jgi:hypothetical protein
MEQQEKKGAGYDRPQHAVNVYGPEAHGLGFRGVVRKTPMPVWMAAVHQIGQMVLDVLAGRQILFASHSYVLRDRGIR